MKKLKNSLGQAGLGHLSAPRLIGLAAFLLAGLGLSVVKVTDIPGLGLAVFALGAAACVEAVKAMGDYRGRALNNALPEVAEAMAASVASGQEMGQALRGLTQLGPKRLRSAFTEFARLDDAGYPLDQSLEWLRLELSNVYADQLIELLLVSLKSGGFGLVGNLQRLSQTIRSQAASEAELMAKQGWVLGTAKLGILSPWLILAFLNQRPEAHSFYASSAGSSLLVIGLLACIGAYFAIQLMAKLPTVKRVFHGND